jgi:Flp pilus assembly pilin Flp
VDHTGDKKLFSFWPWLFRIIAVAPRKREMKFLTTMYVKLRELGKRLTNGQTMTEYALILAAVAVVVFVTYEVMGQDITKLVTIIDSDLVNAS